MTSSVHVQQAVLIAPSDPTPNRILHLSAIDSQLLLRFTFEYLIVFKPRYGRPPDRSAIIRNFQSALAQLLVPYYPLAGRVRRRTDGPGLEVVCRGQGAIFIDAVSDSTVAEFSGAPSCSAQWRQFLALQVDDVLIGAPPLVLQLTWLSDGGAALAAGFNHCLCDGVGSGEFLNSLSELAVGKRGGLAELNPKPVWNRCLLNPKPSGWTWSNSLSHPEFVPVPDVSEFSSRYVRETLVPTCTVFDKNTLDELKKRGKSTYTTSFDVLSAHVWRSWARALNLHPDQVLKLVFSVNIRRRVTPSLPNGYYGNAFVLGCAQTCVRDLTQRSLQFAVELVVKAKERVGDAYVREVANIVSHGKATVDSVGTLIMSQWSRLGLERVEFGMGRPVQVGPVCSDRYCILLPVSDVAGAVKVNLAVPASAVDQYLCFLRSTRV